MENITQEEKRKVLALSCAVEAIMDSKNGVPSGHVYAAIMGHVSLEEYNRLLALLKTKGLVKEENYFLTWTGPRK